jgi:hypothetical protein
VFLLDDCMAPVYGTAMGYLDDCPAAVAAEDVIDEGEPFKRKCADGSTKRNIPGTKSLDGINVSVDLHWFDPEWAAEALEKAPILNNDGEVVGYGTATNDRANVLVVVWQEILGADICAGDEDNCNDWIRMYPLKGAVVSETGAIGSPENVFRISGTTVDSAQLESGPIPLICDTADGEAVWPVNCFPTGQHKYTFRGAPMPTECGSYDTEAPEDPCTPAS